MSPAGTARLSRALRPAAMLCAVVLAALPALAADRVLSPSGSLHSVTVENRIGGMEIVSPGTKLVYRVQATSEESIQSTVIPGTDESVVDSEPAILLSPITFRPVIVWTRNDGADSEIYYSFYNGSVWSVATALTMNGTIDRHPQIFWGRSGYLHVLWTGATTTVDGPVMYEAVLDSKGLLIVAPGPVHTTAGAIVTTNAPAAPNMNATDALFLFDTSYKQVCRLSAQGGYDEPIPVNRRTDFVLPSGSTVDSSKVEVLNGRVVVLVRSGSKMYYSYQSATTGWTPLRSVAIDSTMDAGAAEILIKTMVSGLQ